jgi:hypothetical protein
MKPRIANIFGSTLEWPWLQGSFYWRSLSLIIHSTSWEGNYDYYHPEQIASRNANQLQCRENIIGLKKLNPNLIVLAGTNPIWANAHMVDHPEIIPNKWFARDSNGKYIGDYWGSYQIDPTVDNYAPLEYYLRFLEDVVFPNADILDGVFYDSTSLHEPWAAYLVKRTLEIWPAAKILFNDWSLLRNPNNRNTVNGAMDEDCLLYIINGTSLPPTNRIDGSPVTFDIWLAGYLNWCRSSRKPPITVIGVTPATALSLSDFFALPIEQRKPLVDAAESSDPKTMRFGLCTTLLGDGYYGYDYGAEHGQMWWYPEYDVELGNPLGKAYKYGYLWKREYSKALIVVNANVVKNIIKFTRTMKDYSTGITGKSFTLQPFDGRIFLNK